MYPDLKHIALLSRLASRYYEEMKGQPIYKYMYCKELISCVVTEMYIEIEYPSVLHPSNK